MKIFWFALIALIFGIIASLLVTKYVSIGASNQGDKRVLMAKMPIEAGAVLVATQFQLVAWPSAKTPEGVFTDEKKLIGRVARQSMFPGELIVEAKLASLESKGGLASMITVGKRAISVRVNDVVGVAGFALPGNYVDILVSAKDGTGQPFSKTVLNHVKVLAIAQDTTADPAKPKVVNAVTLELTPSEAEQLDLARSIGTLSLVLRNEIDSLELKSGGASLKDITQHKELLADNVKSVKSLGKKNRTVPKKSKEQSDKMLEIRGVKENEYKESTI